MKTLKCPTYLDKEAKKEWKRVIKISEENGAKIDEKYIRVLERYCVNYSKVIFYEAQLLETGHLIFSKDGYPQQHPYNQLLRNAEQEMRHWMKELIMTPATEARMIKNRVVVVEGAEDKELEEMISK
ncbi:phage terminasesmall subunit [[Clostridium] sordellii]|uniref:phage terminase small subunit P27 family n=1 Tax=Paraclostridium sordellii TaxID=1505 RepID=UPI0005E19F7A|nr:phage terminase small subunit P27 family [Paeniclostridium sordellii]CEQ00540.1 phage terminasesmall subunit [[Clostridium] sordellii] [Paeniclostridium sordellii]